MLPRFITDPFYKHVVAPASHHLAAWRWEEAMRAANVNPLALVDIGSNNTHFGRVLASRFGIPESHVISFEPNKKYPEHGATYRIALGDRPGCARMSHTDTSGFVDPDGPDLVNVCRFDDFMHGRGMLPRGTVVKVDAENRSLQVLRGFGGRIRQVDSVLVEMCDNYRAHMDWNVQTEIMRYMLDSGFDRCNLCYASVTVFPRRVICYDLAWTRSRPWTRTRCL